MEKRADPITKVTPLQDYVLRVEYSSGSTVLFHMKEMLNKGCRFRGLDEPGVWETAQTDGRFVRWPRYAEISFDEILTITSNF